NPWEGNIKFPKIPFSDILNEVRLRLELKIRRLTTTTPVRVRPGTNLPEWSSPLQLPLSQSFRQRGHAIMFPNREEKRVAAGEGKTRASRAQRVLSHA